MSTTGFSWIDDLLNETKACVVEFLNKILPLSFKSNNKFLIECNLVYANYMVITLSAISKREDYLEFLKEDKNAA